MTMKKKKNKSRENTVTKRLTNESGMFFKNGLFSPTSTYITARIVAITLL